jgi:outer membrane protein OmpA-like peptidoglycan-associated protein
VKSNSEAEISVKSSSDSPKAEVNVAATVSPSVHVEQSDSGVVVSTTNGWTGRLQVAAVTTTDNVESDKSSIEIVVNPDAASNLQTTPKSLQNANVQWSPSPSQVVGYEVAVNGNVECKTVTTSCVLPVAIGPKSKVEVTAIGNDQTTSLPVIASVTIEKPIPAIVVNFATNSATLSATAKAELRAVAKVIQQTGYTSLVVTGHTDSVGKDLLNQPLSTARANSTSAYLTKLLPGIDVSPAGFSKNVPVASNASTTGKAANRRAEVSVR